MSSSLADPLFRAATLTFEELALLYATPLTDPIQATPEAEIAVAFHGLLRGRLVLRAFDGLLPTLAANMMGDDAAPPRQLQLDALGEVANVICGNLLPAVGGVDEIYGLDTPRAIGEATGGPDEIPELPVADVSLELEGGRAQVLLYLCDPAVPEDS